MHEVMIKTHLIITDIHNEYHMDWCGSIIDTKPKIVDGKPVFVIRGKSGAVEINTTDEKYLEKITTIFDPIPFVPIPSRSSVSS